MVVIGASCGAPRRRSARPAASRSRARAAPADQAMPPRAVQPGQCRQRCLGPAVGAQQRMALRAAGTGSGPGAPRACRSDRRLAGSQTWGIPAGFDTEGFLGAAKRNFVTLQDAWDRADIATLRSMMTDDMLGEIKSQLAERETHTGGQPNKTEVVMLDAKLLGIEDLPRRLHGQRGVLRDDPRGASCRPEPVPRGLEHDQAQERRQRLAGGGRAGTCNKRPARVASRSASLRDNRGLWPHHRPHFHFSTTCSTASASGLQPPRLGGRRNAAPAGAAVLNHVLHAGTRGPAAAGAPGRAAWCEARWRFFTMHLVATPAGLLDLAPPTAPARTHAHA